MKAATLVLTLLVAFSLIPGQAVAEARGPQEKPIVMDQTRPFQTRPSEDLSQFMSHLEQNLTSLQSQLKAFEARVDSLNVPEVRAALSWIADQWAKIARVQNAASQATDPAQVRLLISHTDGLLAEQNGFFREFSEKFSGLTKDNNDQRISQARREAQARMDAQARREAQERREAQGQDQRPPTTLRPEPAKSRQVSVRMQNYLSTQSNLEAIRAYPTGLRGE